MTPSSRISSALKRWLVFNTVGLMGISVQIVVLMGLTYGLHLNYFIATALAVESAILHNFFWHERWTWADRVEGRRKSSCSRLIYFNLTNGLFSIAGNVILMRVLVEKARLSYIISNILAIAACATLNFIAGDRLVFRSTS